MVTMYTKLAVLILTTTAFNSVFVPTMALDTQSNQQVNIDVYFESLCPDSRRFFLDQLLPTYRDIGHMMKPQLVAFGKARVLANNKMICQHGARECEGNRLMSCIQARGKSDGDIIETLACLFDLSSAPKSCIEKHLNGTSFEDIDKCKNSDESYQMMVKNEQATGKISYVPKVTVNNEYSEEIQQECEHNLKACVCKNYKGSDKSDKCQQVQVINLE